jgi:hypothetical protein
MYIKINLLEVACDGEYWLELIWDRTKVQALHEHSNRTVGATKDRNLWSNDKRIKKDPASWDWYITYYTIFL